MASGKPQPEWIKSVITPRVACLTVVQSKDKSSILLIDRKYQPLGYAFPGGMMQLDETVEQCARRELEEETGINNFSNAGLLCATSDPKFDPRWKVVCLYFVGWVREDMDPIAQDDAIDAFWAKLPLDKEIKNRLTCSTEIVIEQFLQWRAQKPNWVCRTW